MSPTPHVPALPPGTAERRFLRRSRRPSTVRVNVTQSVEPIDFDAWAVRYLAAVMEADRLEQQPKVA